MIPKIVYFTHENKSMLKQFEDIITFNKKNNPDLKLEFYDNERRSKFIEKYYPDFYKLYSRIHSDYGAAKADIFRILILYHYGGIYVDIKTKIKDIYKQIENYPFTCSAYDQRIMRYCNNIFGFPFSNFFISSEKNGKIISDIKNEMYYRLCNFGNIKLSFKYNFVYGTETTGQRTVFFNTGPGLFCDILLKHKYYKVIYSKEYLIYDCKQSFLYKIINHKKIFKSTYHISKNKLLKSN